MYVKYWGVGVNLLAEQSRAAERLAGAARVVADRERL